MHSPFGGIVRVIPPRLADKYDLVIRFDYVSFFDEKYKETGEDGLEIASDF